jgi:CheY-like chemotaxis protein
MNAPKKILLAEDDSDDQKLFYDFLKNRTDIIVLPIVENGEELIDSLNKIEDETQLPDVILLDQNMPKRNGIETLEYLKESSSFSHIPVMIYSTYANENIVLLATKMGASAVVSKPVSKDGYNKMVDDFLRMLPIVFQKYK